MRSTRALVFALLLACTAAGCTTELSMNPDKVVGRNETETRIIDRHEAAMDAAVVMILITVFAVAPLALITRIVYVHDRKRRSE